MEEAECDQSNKNADARSTAAIALQPAYAQSGKDSANARAGEKSGMASSSGETPDRGKTLRAAGGCFGHGSLVGHRRWRQPPPGGGRGQRRGNFWQRHNVRLGPAVQSGHSPHWASCWRESRTRSATPWPAFARPSSSGSGGSGPTTSRSAMFSEVDRLEEIVARLLQFSRADAQELAPGDLNAVLAEAARLARGPAESQGVRIELDLDPALPPVAMAPPALLQVFRNLTTNAIQAMPQGGLLRLATRRGPARRARRGERRRHRAGAGARAARTPVRAVLHDQGRGNRAGPGDRPRDRPGPPGRAPRREPHRSGARRARRRLHA